MRSKSNKYKTNTFKKEKKKEKKKDHHNDLAGEDFSLKKMQSHFKNQRIKKIIGLFFIFLSFYLLLAFTSYLFSWKSEYSIFENKVFNFNLLFDDEIKADNIMGRLGAITSHLFIYKWFGVSSYLFAFVFFIVGTKLFLLKSLLPLSRTIKYSLFSLIWLSVTFGFIFGANDDLAILGGVFGLESNYWLNGIFGKIGTGFILFFLIVAFLIYAFDINLPGFIKKVIQIKFFNQEDNKTEDLTEDDKANNDNKEDKEDITSEDEIIKSIKEREDSAESETDSESLKMDVTFPENEPNNQVDENTNQDTELEIEISDGKLSNSNYQEIEDPFGKNNRDDSNSLSEMKDYDPTLDLPNYKIPSVNLLENYGSDTIQVNKSELEENKDRIIETLNNYSIDISKIKATIGPTVTLYEIIPAPGIRISKIRNLQDDIALSLAALGIRIIAPIPGKGTIGIEVPNSNPDIVSIKSILGSERFKSSNYELPIGLGKTIANETYIADLAKMPHLLIAGATGQGKSVGLNCILTSILYKKHPSEVKFVLVDPKKVELTLFSKIENHYLAKLPDLDEAIIHESRDVVRTLNSLIVEMESRYDLLKEAKLKSLKEYNNKFVSRKLNPNKGHKFLPYIVVVIDEFADLIMIGGKEVEMPISRLAQKSRAVGIHLIIATQRPSVNIITGTIKANFPARIAFRVTSKIDSRTILDEGGAEQLIGRGDMLLSTGSDLLRLQCAFIDTPEIEKITDYIGSQNAYPDAFYLPEYMDEETEHDNDTGDPSQRDELFEEAARIIVATQQGSTSLLQRKLKLGYNRAGRIIDQLEAAGIVGPFEGSKAREVKIKDEVSLEQILSKD